MSFLIKTPMELAEFRRNGAVLYFKGGGSSGGGERPATAEEMRLWAAQADSLEKMTGIAMPNLLTGMNNLGVMANESMDGTLANRLRGMAGADASAAMGQGLTGAGQKLERFGATMNRNALGAQMNNAGLQGAAMKANAMNQANVAAEDTKWNRNSALAGLASGQGTQAINGLGALSGQIGQSRQAAQQADAQSMQGYGMMGAYMGNALFKADGGEVRTPDGAPGFASGGGLQMYRPMSMPIVNPMQFGDSSSTDNPNTMSAMGAVAQPIMMMAAADVAKDGMKNMGLDLKGIGSKAWTGFKDALGAGAKTGVAPTVATPGSAAPAASLSEGQLMSDAISQSGIGGGVVSDGAIAELTADGLGGLAPELGAEVAGTAAVEAGGSTLAGTLGAAAPWLIGGYAIGSLLDLWADGGPVPKQGLKRRDYTSAGGKVEGPGTETSDSIPAWLSDGEYVVNAQAMKDPKDAKTVKKINQKGLQKRRAKQAKGVK